jgi:F-type H+-transporting ATPase subunit b
MQLDGFTLVAQIVNFLILVYLLKRFLYRPILDAMDRREALIGQRLGEAEQREREALAESDRYRHELQTLEDRRRQLLEETRAEAEERRSLQLAEVRREIEQARQDWHDALDAERDTLLVTIRRRLAEHTCQATRRALADLADSDLEQLVVQVLLKRLDELPEAERARFADADPVWVVTAFDLADDQRRMITAALRERGLASDEPQFRRSEALICGLALEAGGYQLTWHVNDYVDQLAERLVEEALGAR